MPGIQLTWVRFLALHIAWTPPAVIPECRARRSPEYCQVWPLTHTHKIELHILGYILFLHLSVLFSLFLFFQFNRVISFQFNMWEYLQGFREKIYKLTPRLDSIVPLTTIRFSPWVLETHWVWSWRYQHCQVILGIAQSSSASLDWTAVQLVKYFQGGTRYLFYTAWEA